MTTLEVCGVFGIQRARATIVIRIKTRVDDDMLSLVMFETPSSGLFLGCPCAIPVAELRKFSIDLSDGAQGIGRSAVLCDIDEEMELWAFSHDLAADCVIFCGQMKYPSHVGIDGIGLDHVLRIRDHLDEEQRQLFMGVEVRYGPIEVTRESALALSDKLRAFASNP